MRRISSARWAFLVLSLWLALASASAATLLETNANWRFFRGRTEASAPDTAAWRTRGFAEAAWEQGPAPFFYGEPLEPLNGTLIGDMDGQYPTLFLRTRFNVGNPGLVRALQLRAVCDDGFAAWINGVRVAGLNAPAEPITRQSLATGNVPEPVTFATFDLPDPAAYLVAGENVLAVQVFNNTLTSSDIVFDAALDAEEVVSASPVIASVTPAPGIVAQLNQVTVTFSEPVQGVQASDFLINGASASGVAGGGATYTFTFPRPPYGTVLASWSPLHTITDLESPPRRFELSSPGASWQYELADPAGPAVAVRQPPAGATVQALRAVAVTFDKPVLGVDAGDLRLNGVTATNVTGYGNGPFLFEFPPVAAGAAEVSWTPGHGIESDAVEPRPLSGGGWSYTVNPAFQPPALKIREIMAENYTAYRDEDQDPEDWIEIRNTGSTPVNLDGWSLSDDDDEPGQWVFPAVVIQPDGHLVVFASGKDRRPLNGRLHASFKLNPNGGMVALYPPELPRVPMDVVEFPEQRPDYSWAAQPPGGTNDWRYFLRGSPGVPNSFSTITGVVDGVHFSVPRGFFPSAFNLSLHCATPGAVIRYTTNGAPPTATNGFVYAAPILISQSRVVRAAAFASNALPSRVTTHTYLVNLAATRLRLPALSLVTDTNNLYGRTGIMEYNPRNCAQRGAAWERPVSVELIRPEDNGGFTVEAGLRVQGGDYVRGQYNYRASSPPQNKYSFRLYFRGEYGQGRLEYPLFPETTQESFDTIVLRAGMNDHTNPYLTDEFIRTLARDTGQPASVGAFVHLFINGVYRGYYNPCERVDVDFLQDYHGGGRLWDVMAQFGEVREGDVTAWNTLRNLCNNTSRPLTNPTNYLAVADRLDLVNFVDYLLPLIWGDNDDWPHNNWRAARERVTGGKYRFYPWDAEWACGIVNGHSPSFNTINNQLSSTAPPWGGADIQQIFNGLKRSPEFQLLFADRVHRHLYNGGALTDERIRARYEQVRARLNGVVSGFNNAIGSTWIPQRRRHLLTHLNAAGFLKSSNAPAMSQFGGRIAPGFQLTLTNQTGAIWYTTDGTDPRVPIAGTVHSNALAYSGPVALGQSLVFKARSLAGTNWSALTEAAFTVESLGLQVRFAEIMYNPAGGDAYEYLELINAGGVPVDVAGWSIEGVNFRFPTPFPAVAPGARLLLGGDANTNQFHQRYGPVPVAGRFGGSLANGGERLALLDRDGRVVTSMTFGDSAPWPAEADGGGYSLEFREAQGDPNSPGNWHASGAANGTPGQPPVGTSAATIVIHELFASGATNQADFIELFNAGNSLLNLGGWTLHDGGAPFTFPANTPLASGAYLVVLCDRETNAPGFHAPFALDRAGGAVWLADIAGRRADAVSYGPQADGWGVGLVTGRWVTTEPTPGGPNEAAVTAPAGSLAINEWLADPLPGDDDWIELHNTSPLAPVSLDGLYLGTSNALFRLPWPGTVAPSGFVRLRADESPEPGHLGFRLPATGGAIVLYDATGAELSRVTYSAQSEGVTSGRVPDATGTPIRLPGTPSPGASNYLAFADGPRLNEFLARNQGSITNSLGRVADFLELHNPAATNVPLAGFSLSVGDAEPGEWAFPTGAVLPAGGHLVVWADPEVAATTNPAPVLQLGRGLPAEGTTLWLFNDRGQALDRVAFGAQLANLSAGRDAGGPWTLLAQPTPGATNAPALPLGDPFQVRLNEWLAGGGEDFVEVFNPLELPVNLGGHILTDDPSVAGRTNHVLAPLTFVAPRRTQHWLASGEPERGPEHLRFRLDVLGETLRLLSSLAAIIDSVDLPPQSPGISEGRWPDGATNLVRFIGSASPGRLNWLPFDGLVITEVLTHTDAPLEDAVELANFSGLPADLAGWWLSDDADQLKKFRLPAAPPLPIGGFTVLYQNAFDAAAQGTNAFALNSAHGGEVWLSEAGADGTLTGRRAHLAFPALANGESWGRVPTSVGEDLAPLAARTLGQPNSAPRVGPVVITEVHYHPMTLLAGVPTENPVDEFLELHNPGPAAVSLFHPVATTNTWRVRGGVDFEFPPGTTLPAGGHALLVGFSPTNTAFAAIFRANFNVPTGVPLYGPFRGRLANDGEKIQLERPDNPQTPGSPDAGFVPWLGVDRVAYAPVAPWPVAADGTGQSLQRRRPSLYGNDPLNWRAAAPTAGRPAAAPADDADDDGMPDLWEDANQFDRLNPADAAGDADGDGVSNALEYLSGTLPRDAASFLRVDIARDGTGTSLLFRAVAGRSYTLLYRDLASGGRWRRLYDVPAAGVNRDLGVPDPSATATAERYYRLVTPARAAGVE